MNSKTNPKITVITVSCNAYQTIEKTIKSVISQNYDNFEYIIIDGGSTDGTTDIIKEYDDQIDYWVSESDNGMYHALNKGLEVSNGQVVGQINSDDLYVKGALEIVADMYAKKQFDLLYGNSYWIDSKGETVKKIKAKRWENIWNGLGAFYHSSCFFSRQILEKVGHYSTDYSIAADIDLLQRVHLEPGSDIMFVDKFLSKQREGGMSRSGLGPFIGIWEYRKANISNGLSWWRANYYFLKNALARFLVEMRDCIKQKIKL